MYRPEDSFYEDEVREGFYVPADIKQAWGAELIVWREIDRICRKYNIKYYAEWGTLLGLVRHGGFIPWDDDLDIGMLRSDYEEFVKHSDELPEGFMVYNFETKPDHAKFISNVVGRARICFEKEHLETFHGYPFITGIDIFISDYMYSDEAKEEQLLKDAAYVINAADALYTGQLSAEAGEMCISKVESICGRSIDRSLKNEKLRATVYRMAEQLFAGVNPAESTHIIQNVPWGLDHVFTNAYPKEWFDTMTDLPFEGSSMMASPYYTALLSRKYGDYMKVMQEVTGHGYPYFFAQKEELIRHMDFQYPEYRYTGEEVRRDGSRGYKDVAIPALSELREMLAGINPGDFTGTADILTDCQEYAVTIGEYIESIKGEGYDVVKLMEELCNSLYEVYRENAAAAEMHIASGADNAAVSSGIESLMAAVGELITTVDNRREIVFMPFKAEHFHLIRGMYNEALAEENTDVYVVPLPYYYKNYDGSLRDMQYHPETYPADIKLTDYNIYDINLHHPDRVVIMNPYDSWNAATSVPPAFYSSALKPYTDSLEYVPWFTLREFTSVTSREYANMSFYVNMPGVVNADRVYVQSENMRRLYIRKLTEFVGEERREYYERSICVLPEYKGNESFPRRTEIRRRKRLLFGMNISELLTHADVMHDKLEKVRECTREYEGRVDVIWYMSSAGCDMELGGAVYREYAEFRDRYSALDAGLYSESELVEMCDAYYGAGMAIARKFTVQGKPVMIM